MMVGITLNELFCEDVVKMLIGLLLVLSLLKRCDYYTVILIVVLEVHNRLAHW